MESEPGFVCCVCGAMLERAYPMFWRLGPPPLACATDWALAWRAEGAEADRRGAERRCIRCWRVKPVTEFFARKKGHFRTCKSCIRATRRVVPMRRKEAI